MTLNQLTYFQKIAQLEHFRLAANELNISQPSLSRSMDTLENELGIPLFEKANNCHHVTFNETELKELAVYVEKNEGVVKDVLGIAK